MLTPVPLAWSISVIHTLQAAVASPRASLWSPSVLCTRRRCPHTITPRPLTHITIAVHSLIISSSCIRETLKEQDLTGATALGGHLFMSLIAAYVDQSQAVI